MASVKQHSPTILVTAFDDFLGMPDGSGHKLLELIQLMDVHSHYKVENVILDPGWFSAPEGLALAYSETNPDILIHFGFAKNLKGFSIESHAYNETVDLSDKYGNLPLFYQIHNGGKPFYETGLDLLSLQKELLDKNIPVEISKDPGFYLSNLVYYHSLQLAVQNKKKTISSLFIHLPFLTHLPILTGLASTDQEKTSQGSDIGSFSLQHIRQGLYQIFDFASLSSFPKTTMV